MTTRRDLIARVEALEADVVKLKAAVKAAKSAATKAVKAASSSDGDGESPDNQ